MKLAIPFKNQHLEKPDEPNQDFNCVPTALASAIVYLTGLPVSGATLKDLVYGTDYVGLTAPAAYLNECARRGVKLWSAGGRSQALIKVIRAQLAQGRPALATIPSQYTQNTGITHVVLFYGMNEPAGTLSAMDPFTGKDVTRIDAEWASLFRVPEIWIAERIKQMVVPHSWRDDGTVLTAPNSLKVVQGFRAFVLDRDHQWSPDNWPLEEEPRRAQLELSHPDVGGGTRQCFRWTVLSWTKQRGVFVAWSGQKLLALEKALQAAQAEMAQLKAQLAETQGNQNEQCIVLSATMCTALQDAQNVLAQLVNP